MVESVLLEESTLELGESGSASELMTRAKEWQLASQQTTRDAGLRRGR